MGGSPSGAMRQPSSTPKALTVVQRMLLCMERSGSRVAARYCVGDVGGEHRALWRCNEAFNRGDLEGAIALVDPPSEFEFVPSGVFNPDLAAVQRGPED